jgi:hypothetical protein
VARLQKLTRNASVETATASSSGMDSIDAQVSPSTSPDAPSTSAARAQRGNIPSDVAPRSKQRLDLELLTRARNAPLTRDAIHGLSRTGTEQLSTTLEHALDIRDIKAATALALAIAAQNAELSPDVALRLIPDIDQRDLVPSLLRACGNSQEERLEVMRQVIERGQLSHDREAIVVFLASELLGEPPWPAPWPGLIRTLARQQLGNEAGVLLGLVIAKSDHEDIKAVGEEWLELNEKSNADEVAKFWLEGFNEPVLDILPETEPPRVVAGYTVRKAQERPGRNDTCHCGSGKKYKKCCAAKDEAQERVSETPQTDVSRASATDVEGMRIQEVLALPFEKLARPALVAAIRQLRAYHRWQDAERALDVLDVQSQPHKPKDTSKDSESGMSNAEQVEELREFLIEEALRMRALDVLDRQLEKVRDPEAIKQRVRAGIECARPSAATLSVLDEQARQGLSGDIDATADVAFSLLDHAPALGILVARGALDPERIEDSDTLLEEIECARDRLDLSPGDPFGPLYDEWVEERKAESARKEASESEFARTRAELERAEQEVDERQAQVVVLEHEIRDLRERLERQVTREQSAGMPQDSIVAAYRSAEENRQRLTRKVEEMKALLAEGNVERAALRERVAELEAAREATSRRSDSDSAEIALDGSEEEATGEEATMPVRIPMFAARSIEALREMPPKVGRQAVTIAGRLGAGDRAAWRDVKRMQGMEGVWTARIGIHHRLIFTVDEENLQVRDVVTREALLTTLERYR